MNVPYSMIFIKKKLSKTFFKNKQLMKLFILIILYKMLSANQINSLAKQVIWLALIKLTLNA